MNKIIVSILTYNAEPFIKYCLDSIYQFADKIVIVEGTYGMQRAFGKRSTDKTIEIIKNYPDPSNKISLIFKNGKEHEHRNEVLKICGPGDWFFTVHTDELYKSKDLDELKNILINDKTTDMFRIVWHNFYFNFKLYLEEVSPPRIYRIKEGCYFDHKDTMLTKDGVEYEKLNTKVLDKNKIIMYHYGYITNIKERMRYYKSGSQWYNNVFTKFSPERSEEIYTVNKILSGEKGIHLQGGGILKTFTGEHPEAMKDHPLRNRDLINDFKNGYVEPEFKYGSFLNRLATMIKYVYYKKVGN